ncbi:ABC transporter substrate-binding protein [Saliphagus sp. GCM10025334]
MRERSNRREILTAVGAMGTITLAGCQVGQESGNGGGEDGGGDGEDGGDGGSTDGGSGPDEITVGATNFLTGRWSTLAPPINQANEIVLQEINEAGGPMGAEWKINQQDNESGDPQIQRELMQQWSSVMEVPFISGINSTGMEANWDFIEELTTPVISTFGSTSFKDDKGGDQGTPDDTSDDGAWVWRTTLSDSNLTIGWVLRMKDLGMENIAVMHNPDPNSVSVADGLESAVEVVEGINVATRHQYPVDNVNLRQEVSQLFDNNDFDGWFFSGGIPQAVQAINAWVEGGFSDTPLVLAEDIQTQELANQAGDVVPDDAVVTSGTSAPAGPAQEHYNELGQEIHGDDFNPAPFAYSRYDSMIVGALAMIRAESTDPEEVHKNIGPIGREGGTEVTTYAEGKEALENGEEINYQGSLTTCDFNDFGDVAGAVAIMDLADGQWEQVETITGERISEFLG